MWFQSAWGSPPSGMCSENLQGEAPKRHPDQKPKPPQPTSFSVQEQQLCSELSPDDRAPHLNLRPTPAMETLMSRLYPGSLWVNIHTNIVSITIFKSGTNKSTNDLLKVRTI
ncbi:hypothetical protein ATANTOWER_002151 [Ataeniobius toweri]|uniref:Uncharacterized protein n=1 Tax=Ataeniobius toweri TaxID=208326 RepID=A0ABU7AEH0_9TELE|nr:hypothetical protein [Ataeniobius toweri]